MTSDELPAGPKEHLGREKRKNTNHDLVLEDECDALLDKARKSLRLFLIVDDIPNLAKRRSTLADRRLEIMKKIEFLETKSGNSELCKLYKEYKEIGDEITAIDDLVQEGFELQAAL